MRGEIEYTNPVSTGRWKTIKEDGTKHLLLLIEFHYDEVETVERTVSESKLKRGLRHIPVISHFIPEPEIIKDKITTSKTDWFKDTQIDITVANIYECDKE